MHSLSLYNFSSIGFTYFIVLYALKCHLLALRGCLYALRSHLYALRGYIYALRGHLYALRGYLYALQ